ncbi:MAG: cyclic nucleotide-binding domain-containing protein, partial [Gammaproteobacteria bacterium]|nr:cyclic nucleotide-binding domain-containing protein [Gammaproteobacteria bacterium]
MTTELTTEQLSKFSPLNSLNSESLAQAIDKIQVESLEADATIFEKGSNDDKHYYLLEGSIDLIGDSGVLKTVVANSKDAFEPIAQIIPRTVTAKAKEYSKIFILDSDVLDMLLTWDQSSAYQVQELSAGSNEESDDWMLQLLRTEAFHRIPPANIQTIFMKMENIAVKPGEQIINQGEDGDYFYVIKKGRCLVT